MGLLDDQWRTVCDVVQYIQPTLTLCSQWIPVQHKLQEGPTHLLMFQTLSLAPTFCCCLCYYCYVIQYILNVLMLKLNSVRDAGTGSLVAIRDDPSAAYHWIVPSGASASPQCWTKTTSPLWQVSLSLFSKRKKAIYSVLSCTKVTFPFIYCFFSRFPRKRFIRFFSRPRPWRFPCFKMLFI